MFKREVDQFSSHEIHILPASAPDEHFCTKFRVNWWKQVVG